MCQARETVETGMRLSAVGNATIDAVPMGDTTPG